MEYLIFTVLFAFLQAAPPVPRKTPDQAATSSKNIQSQTKTQPSTTSDPSTVKPEIPTPENKQEGKQPTKADKPSAIAIREIVPVSVQKDCWDYLYIGLTGLLVVVGGFTLAAIWYQSSQTAIAARATQQNVEAFIASQKAIIIVESHGDSYVNIRIGEIPRVVLDIYNRGKSKAFKLVYETWVEFVPNTVSKAGFSFDDVNFEFSKDAEYSISQTPLSVYPDHRPVQVNVPIPKDGLIYAQRLDFEKARFIVCLRIRCTFADDFDPNRFADFGFWVMRDGLGFLAKYNDSN